MWCHTSLLPAVRWQGQTALRESQASLIHTGKHKPVSITQTGAISEKRGKERYTRKICIFKMYTALPRSTIRASVRLIFKQKHVARVVVGDVLI